MIDQIKKYIRGDKLSRGISNIKYNKLLFKFIIEKTSHLLANCLISERIYCLKNNITILKKCNVCENPVNFRNFQYGYNEYCGYKCAARAETTKLKRKTTNIKLYGHECNLHSTDGKQKVLETLKSKYGNILNISQLSSIKLKKKETLMKNYGVKSVGNLHTLMKNSILKKYGVENISQIKSIRDKILETKRQHGTLIYPSLGKQNSALFAFLEKQLRIKNVEFDSIEYGTIEDGKITKKEHCIYVGDISSKFSLRFLDCFIKIKDRYINFEYNEKWHSKPSIVKLDNVRYAEIKSKIPSVEIYIIDENLNIKHENLINDMINIIRESSFISKHLRKVS